MTDARDVVDLELFQAAQRYLRGVKQNSALCSTDGMAAWETFYSICDGLIHKFASASGAAGSDLEDCAQETWAHLLSLLTSFQYDPSRGQFRTWLYRIVRSSTIDFLRRRRQQERIRNRLVDLAPDSASEPVSEDRRSADLLRRARRHLSAENYRLVRLRWIDGRSVSDVAAELGLTREQVWYHEHRIRKNLRKALAESESLAFEEEAHHGLRAA